MFISSISSITINDNLINFYELRFLAAAKPRLTTRPRPVERARESGIVEFTCVASGHPHPDYSWWRDNRIVNSDGRVTVSNGGQGERALRRRRDIQLGTVKRMIFWDHP